LEEERYMHVALIWERNDTGIVSRRQCRTTGFGMQVYFLLGGRDGYFFKNRGTLLCVGLKLKTNGKIDIPNESFDK